MIFFIYLFILIKIVIIMQKKYALIFKKGIVKTGKIVDLVMKNLIIIITTHNNKIKKYVGFSKEREIAKKEINVNLLIYKKTKINHYKVFHFKITNLIKKYVFHLKTKENVIKEINVPIPMIFKVIIKTNLEVL